MTRENFDDGMVQMVLASHRKYSEPEKDFFFSKLDYIPDKNFQTLVDWYISEVPPPTNIIGYFRKRYMEMVPKEKKEDTNFDGEWGNVDFYKEQMASGNQCTNIALFGHRQKKLNYKKWALRFEREWNDRRLAPLTQWLKEEKGRLIALTGFTGKAETKMSIA